MRRVLIISLVMAGCMKHIPAPNPTGSGRNVTLNWDASTTPDVTYNAYRFAGACATAGAATKPNASPITALTYTDLDVPVGTWCYWATSYLVASQSQESAPSNKAEVEIITQPQPPQNLTITPATVTMQTGGTQQFAASLPDATWSISPADMGTIDATGLYRAPASIKGNNVQVEIVAHSGVETATAAVTLRKN
jgi:hypothetical protein